MKLPTITGPDHSEQQALHAGRKRGLVWRLAPVLALTVGAILWLGWQFWALHEETERIRTRDFRLVELSGTIIHLDEVLTMSARMAAATLAAAQLTKLLAEFDPGAVEFIEENAAALRTLLSGDAWLQFEKLVQSYAFAEAQVQLEHALTEKKVIGDSVIGNQ